MCERERGGGEGGGERERERGREREREGEREGRERVTCVPWCGRVGWRARLGKERIKLHFQRTVKSRHRLEDLFCTSFRAMNSGGAVFAGDQSTVHVEGRISANAAFDDGGGVASFQAAILILGSGSILQQNSAGNRAGGIFVGGSGALIGKLLKRGGV